MSRNDIIASLIDINDQKKCTEELNNNLLFANNLYHIYPTNLIKNGNFNSNVEFQ